MIMNRNKQIFGVVDKTQKSTDYTGATTESAKVTVDNQNREISVDVIFDSKFLGQTSDKAYPGDYGAQSRKLIINLEEDLKAETTRAEKAENDIKKIIENESWETSKADTAIRRDVNAEIQRIETNYATKTYVYQQLSEFSKLSKQIADSIDLENNKVVIKGQTIIPVDGVVYLVKSTSINGDDIYKQYTLVEGNLTLIGDTTVDLTDYAKIDYVDEAESRLNKSIDAVYDKIDEVSSEVDRVEVSVDDVRKTYADKDYVQTKIVEFSKLSKQIADAVDTENNKVVVKGQYIDPVEGVVYLVSEKTNDGEDSYKQYTTIDGELTLIGGTQIDLTDYATKDYVDNQIDAIPEVDLTDYAKKSDIPDVSEFLSSIPEEYVTDEELSPYATKSYVQAELSKVGSLAKQIVDSIDLKNKTVVIDGIITPVKADTIYLVPKEGQENAFAQYVLIDNDLTWIGDTDVDLKGYATQEYVDEKFNTVKTDIETLLSNLKFIDGGTSSSLNI